jgi:hypothetical protein
MNPVSTLPQLLPPFDRSSLSFVAFRPTLPQRVRKVIADRQPHALAGSTRSSLYFHLGQFRGHRNEPFLVVLGRDWVHTERAFPRLHPETLEPHRRIRESAGRRVAGPIHAARFPPAVCHGACWVGPAAARGLNAAGTSEPGNDQGLYTQSSPEQVIQAHHAFIERRRSTKRRDYQMRAATAEE